MSNCIDIQNCKVYVCILIENNEIMLMKQIIIATIVLCSVNVRKVAFAAGVSGQCSFLNIFTFFLSFCAILLNENCGKTQCIYTIISYIFFSRRNTHIYIRYKYVMV